MGVSPRGGIEFYLGNHSRRIAKTCSFEPTLLDSLGPVHRHAGGIRISGAYGLRGHVRAVERAAHLLLDALNCASADTAFACDLQNAFALA